MAPVVDLFLNLFEISNLPPKKRKSKLFSVTDEWVKYSAEFVVAENTWKFYLVLKSQDGKIDFDQVELKIKKLST